MTLRLEQSENPRLEARVSKGGLIAPVRTTRFTGGTDIVTYSVVIKSVENKVYCPGNDERDQELRISDNYVL